MAGKNDLYDQLGIQSDATKNDIRMAYHRKALKYHPDKNSDTDASEKFKSISQAYETLLDSVTNNPPIEVFKVAVQGLSPEEIDVNITIDELLDRWSDLRVAKLPIKERLGLREDQHYTDLIDAFLDQGRLLHIHTVGKDKRQPIAYKGSSNTLFTRRSYANSESSSTRNIRRGQNTTSISGPSGKVEWGRRFRWADSKRKVSRRER